MAATIAAHFLPQRLTLGGSNALTEVTFPAFTKRARVRFIANAGKVARVGTDAAAIGTDFETLTADLAVELALPYRAGDTTPLKLYLAAQTGSTVVEVSALR